MRLADSDGNRASPKLQTGDVTPELFELPVVAWRSVPATDFARHFARKYRHRFRKLAFFARMEGVVAAFRKARSKLAEKKIERDQVVVVAHIVADGRHLIGFTRFLGGPFTFHPRLVFEGPGGQPLERVELGDDTVRLMESYMPVSACPVPEALPDRILEDNPWLAPLAGDDRRWLSLGRSSQADDQGRVDPSNGASDGEAARRSHSANAAYVVGLGGYAREHILPEIGRYVAGAADHKARLIRKHVSLPFPVDERLDTLLTRIQADTEPLVVVASYHSDHFSVAARVLQANPNARVFIEKPATVTLQEAFRLAEMRRAGAWIDVGYNRRYAPLTATLKAEASRLEGPYVFSALVKELAIPQTHWYHWPSQGTRITGNLCHWLDLARFVTGSRPQELTLLNTGEQLALAVLFEDGSLAQILATDVGDDLRGVQESIEVRAAGTTLLLDDYIRLVSRSGDGRRVWRSRRNKGHRAMYRDLVARWRSGDAPRYPVEDLLDVVQMTEVATRMWRSGHRWQAFSAGQQRGT